MCKFCKRIIKNRHEIFIKLSLFSSFGFSTIHFIPGDFNTIDNTTINGDQAGSVVTFDQGEQYLAQLIVFTITNGYGAGVGETETDGGITIKSGSNPIIEFCKIKDNSSLQGGGILIHYSDLVIKNCWIRNNVVLGDLTYNLGGGIFTTHSDFTF